MSVLSDLKTLYHLTTAPIRGSSHQERLESFYSGQASGYDHFRRRLLQGREELFVNLGSQISEGAHWIDFGSGTGSSIEFMGPQLHKFEVVELADLSESLLRQAQTKIDHFGWKNVSTKVCDVSLPFGDPHRADLVTFSYSLTMIPNWFAALETAWSALKPGGLIGIVDFYVSRKYAEEDCVNHPWLTRTFWPAWFALDNVFLSPDHLPYLRSRFLSLEIHEARAKIPYLPFVRAPYYHFIGRKRP